MVETPGIASVLLIINRALVLTANGGNFVEAETIGFVGCVLLLFVVCCCVVWCVVCSVV